MTDKPSWIFLRAAVMYTKTDVDIIGYAAANRLLRSGPGVWHCMMVVRDKKPNAPVTVGAVIGTAAATTAVPAAAADGLTRHADLLAP
jgi:hypothetical protein